MSVTGYQNPIAGYRFEIPDSKVAGKTEQYAVEAQNGGNVRRSISPRGLPQILQDFELFCDNEVNDDGDFVLFGLMPTRTH